MKPVTIKNIIVVTIFSIEMAALESAVVVYLRALYYPDGFTVALKLIDKQILLIEILREAATLVMIWSVAYLTGRKRYDRLAYFLICFAVWDIFYYAWLKVFIDWPLSVFDWDILFLIPVTWLGPVLSPIICSLTMIVLAIVILCGKSEIKFNLLSTSLLIGGSLLILYTYLVDYGRLIINNNLISDYLNLFQSEKFIALATTYLPTHYDWTVFWFGELVICIAVVLIYINSKMLISRYEST